MLGLEISHLLISYFMGKKKLICVRITKHEGREGSQDVVDQFSSSVSSGDVYLSFSLTAARIAAGG